MYPHLCASIIFMEHRRLGALGGFHRLNLLNMSHVVPWLEHPICSCCSEGLSGERDVEVQANERKNSRKTDECGSCDRIFNLQACAYSVECFIGKSSSFEFAESQHVRLTNVGECSSKFGLWDLVVQSLLLLLVPLSLCFRRKVFVPTSTSLKPSPFVLPTHPLLFKNSLLFGRERLCFNLI